MSGKIETDELSKCSCGAKVVILDDAMSLIVACQKCGKSTEEYLYGAGSFMQVETQIIRDWNKLVGEDESMKKSTCCTCGYQWLTGQDGSHQCSIELLSKIENMAKALQKIKDIVVGGTNPSFSSHIRTTQTRMKIADICDGSLYRGIPALDE